MRLSERKEGLPFMQSDTDRLWGAGADEPVEVADPGPPAPGSADYIRRSLVASRGLCRPGSLLPGIIDAHLAAVDMNSAPERRRAPGQDF